jgi:hypothetical protein
MTGVNTIMTGVNTNMTGVNTNMTGVNTNMTGVNTIMTGVNTTMTTSSVCWAGGFTPNILHPNAAYCTNPALVYPFISRGAPHQTT